MTKVSVLTIVRNREAHLRQLVEGLRRSARQPDELIVVDMSDVPIELAQQRFAHRIERLATDGLPLAAARNRAAARATGSHLIFLDVDCIPMADCLGRLSDELDREDALLCADIRYLGPDDARGGWSEAGLLAGARRHPARSFPSTGVWREPNYGLFWSLAFAIRADRFASIGGFDERFTGYGGEDTDLGFRAGDACLSLLFVGGAIACHQHHASHEPPVQHVRDIVDNANLFHAKWGRWPMEGWLAAFERMGLIAYCGDRLVLRRTATPAELSSTLVSATGFAAEDGEDRMARTEVLRA